MTTTEARVKAAVDEVRRVIESVVREEQLRDGLTSLANDAALSDRFDALISHGSSFWCAFVEIDRFKQINEAFGYQNADALLVRVARHLASAADFFPNGVAAFRAHGDEFFLVGPSEDGPSLLEPNLNHIREGIAKIAVPVEEKSKNMGCTVSIGWLLSGDLDAPECTDRGIRLALEHAVSHAKRKGRNCVVRFSAETRKLLTQSVRDTCRTCESAFAVDIPVEKAKSDRLFCPNCGERHDRPGPKEEPPPPKNI